MGVLHQTIVVAAATKRPDLRVYRTRGANAKTMGMNSELNQLQEELRANHLQRIYDMQPGLSYFKLMKRGNEILKRISEITLNEPTAEPINTLWSDREIRYLRSVYDGSNAQAIAKRLKRTKMAVQSKAYQLRITKTVTQ